MQRLHIHITGIGDSAVADMRQRVVEADLVGNRTGDGVLVGGRIGTQFGQGCATRSRGRNHLLQGLHSYINIGATLATDNRIVDQRFGVQIIHRDCQTAGGGEARLVSVDLRIPTSGRIGRLVCAVTCRTANRGRARA